MSAWKKIYCTAARDGNESSIVLQGQLSVYFLLVSHLYVEQCLNKYIYQSLSSYKKDAGEGDGWLEKEDMQDLRHNEESYYLKRRDDSSDSLKKGISSKFIGRGV